jgi:CubicO group peptidase (beta-lactamase class C family)
MPGGFCDPAFTPVLDLFVEHFRVHPTGGPPELGASVAVVVDGETVVDLWDGWADEARTRQWERDTVVNVFSAGKGMAALAIAMLVDDGLIDYGATMSSYWPEFASNGKSEITVSQMLSHQAGLPGLSKDLGTGGAWDYQRVIDGLAEAEPAWKPGNGMSYHSVTFGFLANELVRRVTGEHLAAFTRTRISGPLGVDFFVGMSQKESARAADMVPFPGGPAASVATFEHMSGTKLPDSIADLSVLDSIAVMAFADMPNTDIWRASTNFVAAGGHSNARSLARIYGALARGGEIDGVRLLSAETLALATQLQVKGRDLLNGAPWAWANGFMVPHEGPASSRFSGSGFGHGGVYGALGWAEPKSKVGFGYVMNQEWVPLGDPRGSRLLHTALGCL